MSIFGTSFQRMFKCSGIDSMLRFWQVIAINTFVIVHFAAAHAYGSEEVEDLIDIFESNGEIVAVVEGKKSVAFSLRPNENVQWSRAKGNLGAFLTNRHFFVVSTSSHGWNRLPLRPGNARKRIPVLSANIALLVEGDRAFGFNTTSKRFVRVNLPLYDEIVAAKAEKYVAVVVTSSKAYGLSAGASQFSEIRLGVREAVKNVKITSSKVTIRTSHRILSFRGEDSNWNEHRL